MRKFKRKINVEMELTEAGGLFVSVLFFTVPGGKIRGSEYHKFSSEETIGAVVDWVDSLGDEPIEVDEDEPDGLTESKRDDADRLMDAAGER